tara:strand:- start:231 stop:815 length:585 start_codon:yes stop_codon:yes gene_type:complete
MLNPTQGLIDRNKIYSSPQEEKSVPFTSQPKKRTRYQPNPHGLRYQPVAVMSEDLKKYQYFPQFINLLFYFKIFIICLGIFSIFLRIYDFVSSTSSDSLINNIDYLNYIAVLILVLISSVYIVFIYNKKYYSIIQEMHRKIYDTFSISTDIEKGYQNDILESLIFWMFIYFIILVFSILVSKFTNNLNYTTELL